MDVVNDFNLPDDLVSRLLASIEEVTAPVLTPDSIQAPLEYLAIVLFAPAEHKTKGRTWGFFRVERTSTDTLNDGTQGHCVEYYLYSDKTTGE